MENTKIGNKEAIALLTTISFNQIIIFGVKYSFKKDREDIEKMFI